jgi:hypothetical protein
MRNVWLAIAGVVLVAALAIVGMNVYEDIYIPKEDPGDVPFLEIDQRLVTVNTTRVGSDDPVETAAAVANIIYPATESENTPGAVVLVNRHNLAEVLVAASRVQHFPVNAPLLYVEENSIPELTRKELLRLRPEGVAFDGNVQVYLVGSIGDDVVHAVQKMGYKTRVLRADNPVELAVVADDWTSTQHGDHRNVVAIANIERPELAIPAAYWNAHMGQGFAYVTSEGVPEATKELLQRRANGPWIYLFGDEQAIPASVARELAQYGMVERMPRNDLPAISAYFAGFKDLGGNWGAWFWQGTRDFGWGISEAGHNAVFVNPDGPAGWQNAIVATTLSHMGKHAPVLVVTTDEVPADVSNYLKILKPYATDPQQQQLNHGWIIGGEETISWETQVELDRLLEAYPTGKMASVESASQGDQSVAGGAQ